MFKGEKWQKNNTQGKKIAIILSGKRLNVAERLDNHLQTAKSDMFSFQTIWHQEPALYSNQIRIAH